MKKIVWIMTLGLCVATAPGPVLAQAPEPPAATTAPAPKTPEEEAAQQKAEQELALRIEAAEATFNVLMAAIKNNDRDAFIALGSDDFKKALTKELFAAAQQAVGPRLRKGYTAKFLGNLQQRGQETFLWKISLDDKGDDILAILSLKGDVVGGFLLS